MENEIRNNGFNWLKKDVPSILEIVFEKKNCKRRGRWHNRRMREIIRKWKKKQLAIYIPPPIGQWNDFWSWWNFRQWQSSKWWILLQSWLFDSMVWFYYTGRGVFSLNFPSTFFGAFHFALIYFQKLPWN